MDKIKPRWFQRNLQTALRVMPVSVLTGARQTGKTTPTRAIEPARAYFTLDDVGVLDQAERDPDSLLATRPAILDEVQRAPHGQEELWSITTRMLGTCWRARGRAPKSRLLSKLLPVRRSDAHNRCQRIDLPISTGLRVFRSISGCPLQFPFRSFASSRALGLSAQVLSGRIGTFRKYQPSVRPHGR
jgi:hypothetical protein